MAGERLLLKRECCKGLPRVQTHTDARNRWSAFSTERTTQSPWQFRYSRGEKWALCRCPITALNMLSSIIRELVFITVQDLWPPALKRDPASERHGGYSRQYGIWFLSSLLEKSILRSTCVDSHEGLQYSTSTLRRLFTQNSSVEFPTWTSQNRVMRLSTSQKALTKSGTQTRQR